MSYSRWADTWPGGGPSWYIYHDVNGKLFCEPPGKSYYDGFLNKRDVEYLRDLLTEALDDWGDEPGVSQ